jgi:tellurite resistance protein
MPVYSLYLIIFGTRGLTLTAAEGDFHCPDCGPAKYRHRKVRRFFTLYFIPLIPLDLLGEYVECTKCQGTYKLGVLQHNPEASDAAFEAEFLSAIRRTMVLMSLADGVVDPEEIATIQRVFGQIAKREITEQEVRNEITAAQIDGRPVAGFLAGNVAATLNDHGKEMVVRSAFYVAAADGQFQDQERQLLTDIGRALQLTPAHLQGIIQTLLGEAQAA